MLHRVADAFALFAYAGGEMTHASPPLPGAPDKGSDEYMIDALLTVAFSRCHFIDGVAP